MSERILSASGRAHAYIKERLLTGVYEEGELLSEGAIAGELGISRTPVREACLQLEAEGLLRLYPKRGALVVPITSREIAELFDARLLVERHTLGLADPAAMLDALDDLVARQRAIADDGGDRLAFAAADRDFHRVWVAAAGNRVLLDLYDHLRDRQQRVASVILATDPDQMRRLADQHEQITAALRAGDRTAADAHLVEHLRSARERSGGTPAATAPR